MKLATPEVRDALAAEYVLGTLAGTARRRLARMASVDRALAAHIARWEALLTPLAESVQPVTPPDRVWQAIEARIGSREAPQSWWDSLAFWRNWGLAATGLAAALMIATAVIKPAPAPEAGMFAVLSTPENVPRMIVEKHAGMIKVKVVKAWASLPENDLELWVVPKSGAPRSLGVVSYAKDSEVRMANLENLLADGAAFAISKEPKGGSPSGAPTGPVLCSGAIAKMPQQKA